MDCALVCRNTESLAPILGGRRPFSIVIIIIVINYHVFQSLPYFSWWIIDLITEDDSTDTFRTYGINCDSGLVVLTVTPLTAFLTYIGRLELE